MADGSTDSWNVDEERCYVDEEQQKKPLRIKKLHVKVNKTC